MGNKDRQLTKNKTQAQTYKTQVKEEVIEMTTFSQDMEEMNTEKSVDSLKFPKVSSIPSAASKKDGGILGFFRKKDISARNAPNTEADNNADNAEVVDGKLQRAVVDLNDEERSFQSVVIMRDHKSFFGEKAKSDLEKKRDVPLTDFTKDILKNIKKLGGLDITLFTDRDARNAVKEMEMAASKKCLPFLLKYINDIDKLEADHKNPELKQRFNEEYGHIPEEEQRLLRIYAELLRDTGGMLDTKGAQLNVIEDTAFKVFESTDLLPAPKPGFFHYRSEQRFEDKSEVPLFMHKPNIYDLQQGDLGDCYMISSLISIVNANPDVITNCMKDNGDSVTVRFFKDNRPVYITVKKSVPYREHEGLGKDGATIKKKYTLGASGTLWVNMIEKAYTAFKFGGDYRNIRGEGTTGAADFITALTKKDYEGEQLWGDMNYYMGVNYLPEEVEVKSLVKDVRKSERAAFEDRLRRQGTLPTSKNERNLLWNKEKARIFFGISAQEYDQHNLAEMFRKNTAFTAWADTLKKKMSEFTTSGVRTITEFGMVINSIKETEFPRLGIPGLSEERMRKHYIEAMTKLILSKEKLFSISNNYEYDEKERRVYRLINEARERKAFITTGTSKLRFQHRIGRDIEHNQEGVYSNHSYAILGTKEKTIRINGKDLTRRFVIILNPWQHGSRLYDSNGMGFDQMEIINDNGTYDYNNHGIFLMELKDFCYSYASMEIQG